MEGNDLLADLGAFLAEHEAELIDFRRDLHAHPELAFNEHRTTRRVALRLAAAGLRPVILPKGTGLLVDIGSEQVPYTERPVVALRADLDALPMMDDKDVPYRSTVPDVCHACGHDVHTTVLLGAGLFLAQQAAAGLLPGRVRLIFQPAEEAAGGALDVLAAGGIASVGRIFAGGLLPFFMAPHTGSPTIFFGTIFVVVAIGAFIPLAFGRETVGQLETVTEGITAPA